MPIFISHSHEDKEFVDRLAIHLINHNAKVWVDRWEIKVGDSLIERIQREIQRSSAILFVLSNASVKSDWCRKELNAGLMRELDEKATVVMPVLIEKCAIPIFLKEKRYADFTDNFDAGLKDIIEAIAKVANANQSRIEYFESDENFTHDWALDWGIDSDTSNIFLRYTLVERDQTNPYSVLTNIYVFGNDNATMRYNLFQKEGLDWFERLTIAEAIAKFTDENDFRMLLTDSKEHQKGFSIVDSKQGIQFDVIAKLRWLGDDTGNDVLVDVGNQIRQMYSYQKAVCRPLTEEEKQRLRSILYPA